MSEHQSIIKIHQEHDNDLSLSLDGKEGIYIAAEGGLFICLPDCKTFDARNYGLVARFACPKYNTQEAATQFAIEALSYIWECGACAKTGYDAMARYYTHKRLRKSRS